MAEDSSDGVFKMSNDARRLHKWLLSLGATTPEFAIARRAFLKSVNAVIGEDSAPVTWTRFCSAWRSLRAAGVVHIERSSIWADR